MTVLAMLIPAERWCFFTLCRCLRGFYPDVACPYFVFGKREPSRAAEPAAVQEAIVDRISRFDDWTAPDFVRNSPAGLWSGYTKQAGIFAQNNIYLNFFYHV